MRVGLAADHQGIELKNLLLSKLQRSDFELVDYGAYSLNAEDDFPDFIIPMAEGIAKGEIERGIAICGSGVGACIAANKVRGVRGALISDLFSAKQGVEDDDMNVICIGSRSVTSSFAIKLIQSFLVARFSALPRFKRRLEKISTFEKSEFQS